MTKKITRVTAVHTMRCWKGTLVSGTETSGMRGVNGLTKSRKRTVWMDCQRLFSMVHSTEPLMCFVLRVLRVMRYVRPLMIAGRGRRGALLSLRVVD
jgi:hypothetical protein